MSLDEEQLVELIISPVLQHMNLHSPEAVQLLLTTAKTESRLRYLKQLGGGPALGLWQMEPATHDDIWENYLAYREVMANSVLAFSFDSDDLAVPHAKQMIGNLWYACAMARVHYMRIPEALPRADDLLGQAQYWKAYYNTSAGAGTVDGFMQKNQVTTA